MPPSKSAHRKASIPSEGSEPDEVVHAVTVPPKDGETPNGHQLENRGITITSSQKQALIDNLQLEITERARKLRAQYALQAQGLRTRVEIRVNRIPISLRKAKMGELLEKCESQQCGRGKGDSKGPGQAVQVVVGGAHVPAKPSHIRSGPLNVAPATNGPRTRSAKRASDELEPGMDKENTPQAELPNPKKRTKTAANVMAANRHPSRSKAQPSQILSPKSSNSRTLPQSPIRPLPPPPKTGVARVASPMKPSGSVAIATSTLIGIVETATTRTTRAVSGRKAAVSTQAGPAARAARAPRPAPRKAAEKRVVSNSSEASDATTGTVVTKAKTVKKAVSRTKTTSVVSTKKKIAPAKEEVATSAPKRVLRKRA